MLVFIDYVVNCEKHHVGISPITDYQKLFTEMLLTHAHPKLIEEMETGRHLWAIVEDDKYSDVAELENKEVLKDVFQRFEKKENKTLVKIDGAMPRYTRNAMLGLLGEKDTAVVYEYLDKNVKELSTDDLRLCLAYSIQFKQFFDILDKNDYLRRLEDEYYSRKDANYA